MYNEQSVLDDSDVRDVIAEALKGPAVFAWRNRDNERLEKVSNLFFFFFRVYLPDPIREPDT